MNRDTAKMFLSYFMVAAFSAASVAGLWYASIYFERTSKQQLELAQKHFEELQVAEADLENARAKQARVLATLEKQRSEEEAARKAGDATKQKELAAARAVSEAEAAVAAAKVKQREEQVKRTQEVASTIEASKRVELEKAAAEKLAVEKTAADKVAADRALAKATHDKAEADLAAAEKVASDKRAADLVAAERASAAKSASTASRNYDGEWSGIFACSDLKYLPTSQESSPGFSWTVSMTVKNNAAKLTYSSRDAKEEDTGFVTGTSLQLRGRGQKPENNPWTTVINGEFSSPSSYKGLGDLVIVTPTAGARLARHCTLSLSK